MAEPETIDTPAPEPETRSVPKFEFYTILIAVIGIGVALGSLMLNATGQADADRRAYLADAAADRRASDARMAEFRNRMDQFDSHMRRLGERPARLEGQREGTVPQ